ncbi:MAG: MFS transporter [Desulfovibrionaceae bacterium]|nr:MFS transporter [Desulfovibrionaceae bacterium]
MQEHGNKNSSNGFQRLAAAFSVLLSVALVIIDGTIVTVALPVMAGALQVGENTSIWLVNAYQLILLAFLFPAISLARQKGCVRLFLGGILFFTAASLGCALSRSFAVLMLFRILQALGGAAILSVNLALIKQLFQGEQLGRGVAVNTATISLSIIIAPGLAGLILLNASWPWLFAVNIPLGLIAFFAGRRFLRETCRSQAARASLPVTALALNLVIFAAGFLVLSVPVYGLPLWTLPCSCLALAAGLHFFLRSQNREGSRMRIYPSVLLFDSRLRLTMLCLVFGFMAQSGTVLALPFLLMGSMGFGIADTSLLLICWPVLHIAASLLSGFAAARDRHWMCLLGLLLCAAGITSLLFCGPSESLSGMALRIGLCGLGYGLFQAPNDTLSMACAPAGLGQHVSALLAFSRTLGQALGSMVTAAAFFWLPQAVTLPFLLTALLALAGAVCVCLRSRQQRSFS